MHTETTSLWPDWQRQYLSIHIDRAVAELRRGRPVLMVTPSESGLHAARDAVLTGRGSAPFGAALAPSASDGQAWLLAAVETLTPEQWKLLRGLVSEQCLVLSSQRVAMLDSLRIAAEKAKRVGGTALSKDRVKAWQSANEQGLQGDLPWVFPLYAHEGKGGDEDAILSFLHALDQAAGLVNARSNEWEEFPRGVGKALYEPVEAPQMAGGSVPPVVPGADVGEQPHDGGFRAPVQSACRGEVPVVVRATAPQLPASTLPAPMAVAALALAREARLVPAVVAVRLPDTAAQDVRLRAHRTVFQPGQPQASISPCLDPGFGTWLLSLMQVDQQQVLAHVRRRAMFIEEAGAIPLDILATSDAPVPLQRLDQAAGGQVAPGTLPIGSRFVVFREKNTDFEHVAVIVGDPDFNGPDPVRVRLHSSCLTGDLFGSLRCDCGDQLRGTVQRLAREGGGIILYLSQEGRGIGIANKLRAYRLQDAGLDTLDANQSLGFRMDERHFEVAAAMLKSLGCTRIQLLTNNPAKIGSLRAAGIDVVEREAVKGEVNPHNQQYLVTKMKRAGHLFERSELRLPDGAGQASGAFADGSVSVALRAGDAASAGDAARAGNLDHPGDAVLQSGGVPLPASVANDAGLTPSRAIRARIQQAGQRFHANDNIAGFIQGEDELALLQDEVAERMQALLESLVIDTASDHNTQDTARRVARMYLNEVFAGRYRAAPDMTEFPNVEKLNELLVVGPITVRSACSHHFCPIMGRLWVGVLPNADSNLIGLSKYARLADWIMSRPQIQEEAVKTLADELERRLAPDGLAVIMKADHFCMHWRGVKDESQMTSSVMRGAFLRNSSLRRELLSLIADMGKG